MLWWPVILGAILGAAGGVLIGRTPVCSKGRCTLRSNRIAAIVGGAVFGAAVGWWLMGR